MKPAIAKAAEADPPAVATPAGGLEQFFGDPQFMQSLARGLLALGAVSRGRGHPVSVHEIAACTGLSVATVRRCLYTLNATGHVRANRNGAVAGPELAALAIDYAASSPLVSNCGPILDALRVELGLTVSLTLFEGDQATIVASSSTESFLKLEIPVGTVLPLHASSSGKLYLASLDPDRRAELLERIEYRALLGPYTPLSSADVHSRLAGVQEQGYAVSDQELAAGLLTVSAPVRDHRGLLLGAVSTSVLSSEVTSRIIRTKLAPALLAAATGLSALVP